MVVPLNKAVEQKKNAEAGQQGREGRQERGVHPCRHDEAPAHCPFCQLLAGIRPPSHPERDMRGWQPGPAIRRVQGPGARFAEAELKKLQVQAYCNIVV